MEFFDRARISNGVEYQEGHEFQVVPTQPAHSSVDEAEHMAQFNHQIACERDEMRD